MRTFAPVAAWIGKDSANAPTPYSASTDELSEEAAAEILNRKFTPVLASHSLREIEDICDHVGLLHRGGILFAKDVDEMKLDIHKVQCVIPDPVQEAAFLQALPVLHYEKRGSLLTVIVRGTRAELEQKLLEQQPLFSEILPLTLEEIFISETEVAGYDVRNLIY